MRSFKNLPDSYKSIWKCNIKEDKKLFWFINIGNLILLLPFIPLYLLVGPNIEFNSDVVIFEPYPLIFCLLFIAIIVLHELIHGIFFKLGTREKVKFSFHGFAASASVPGVYFKKKHYILIGLAPAIILNMALIILLCFISSYWFLMVYILLAFHFSGCIGDFYVIYKLLRMPKDTLIEDIGIGMEFFSSVDI